MATFKQRLKEYYNLTVKEYEERSDLQGGVCAICGRPETVEKYGEVQRLSVDHDHDTGIIRGLLCMACNALIGQAAEDPAVLVSAVNYLRNHET